MSGRDIFKISGHRYQGSDNSDNSLLFFFRGYYYVFNVKNVNNRDYTNS